MILVHDAKALDKKRKIERIISRFRSGTVVVEGKHDVRKLGMFGIEAMASTNILYGQSKLVANKTIYIMTDNDRGGEEKKSKLVSRLLEQNPAVSINRELGSFFLKLLNVTCAEQIYKPLAEALEINEKIGEYNGKNIFRRSKVSDRIEV